MHLHVIYVISIFHILKKEEKYQIKNYFSSNFQEEQFRALGYFRKELNPIFVVKHDFLGSWVFS